MAVPKRRQSKSRRDKRRATKNFRAPQYSKCPRCSSVKLPHRVCSECGYYGEKQIIVGEEEK